MKRIIFLLCALVPSLAWAEDVRLALDTSYEKAVEILQHCGAQDTTARHDALGQTSGSYWWLEDFGLQIAIGQHYGKVNSLTYWYRKDLGISAEYEARNGQRAQSLALNTETKSVAAQSLPPPVQSVPHSPEDWMVRVELLVVTMPDEKALALLPDLRDPTKIDGAVTQILAGIQHKEVKLIGYPIVFALSGQRTTSETILEKLYPTQFLPPQIPQNFGNAAAPVTTTTTTTTTPTEDPSNSLLGAFPTSFEKRNTGLTLEVEPTVRAGGKLIELNLQPQRVILEGFDSYEALKLPGISAKVDQPRFIAHKESGTILIRNGQRLLIGVHALNEPGQSELHIVQATATQMGD